MLYRHSEAGPPQSPFHFTTADLIIASTSQTLMDRAAFSWHGTAYELKCTWMQWGASSTEPEQSHTISNCCLHAAQTPPDISTIQFQAASLRATKHKDQGSHEISPTTQEEEEGPTDTMLFLSLFEQAAWVH